MVFSPLLVNAMSLFFLFTLLKQNFYCLFPISTNFMIIFFPSFFPCAFWKCSTFVLCTMIEFSAFDYHCVEVFYHVLAFFVLFPYIRQHTLYSAFTSRQRCTSEIHYRDSLLSLYVQFCVVEVWSFSSFRKKTKTAFLKFIFNWSITAFQYGVGFCYTSTWISHKYTYVPVPLETPSHLPPHPTTAFLKLGFFFLNYFQILVLVLLRGFRKAFPFPCVTLSL